MAVSTLVRRAMLQIVTDDGDSQEKLDQIKEKADQLRLLNPEITPRIDTAEAQAKMQVLRDEIKAATAETDAAPLDIRVASADAQAKLDLIKKNAEELRLLNPTLVPRIDDAEASAKLAVLRGEISETEVQSEGLGKAWEVTKYALLGVGAALGYGIYKAAGYSQEILRLHTQAGVATSQLKGLGNGILQLSGQVGQSPDSLAESLYHVESSFASVGIKGPQALALVKAAAQEASVGGANLVDTTNAIDATIAAGVPGIHSYSQAMGALNSIVGSGDMTMQDLADAMGSGVMAVAKSYGQNIYQVGAALAVFGDNNIRGAKAATDLRMAWQALQAPIAAGKPVLESIGLSMTQLGQTMAHQGLSAAVGQFIAHLQASKVPAADWGQYMTEIFGKKAGVGIGILVDQFSRLQSKFPVLEKGASGFNAAWAAQQKTPAQELKDLEQGSEALAIKLGTSLLPAAMKVMGWLTDFVNGLERGNGGALAFAGTVGTVLGLIALKKLEDGLSGAVEGVEGLYKGGEKAVKWAGQMATKLGLLRTAQEETTVATEETTEATESSSAAFAVTPLGLIVLGLTAVTIAFTELWQHSAAFRDFWKDTWNVITVAFDVSRHAISAGFDGVRHDIAAMASAIATNFDTARHDIAQWADDVVHDGEDVVHWFEALPGRLLSLVSDWGHLLWSAGEAVVDGLVGGIESKFDEAVGTIEHLGGDLLGGAKHILGIFSPSQEFYYLGTMVAVGLASGIQAGAPQAVAESRRLAQQVAAAAAEGLITSAEATSLNSKIASALTTALKSGTLAGLTGSASQVHSSEGSLLAMVSAGISGGILGSGQGSALSQWVEQDTTKLERYANARAKLLATIKTADAYANSVTSSTESTFSLTAAAGAVTSATGVGGIIGQLLGDVSQIRTFKANIAKLRKMGLNKAYIDQLIQAGPVTGGQIASELAAGNEGDIRQVNAAESAIASASSSLGQTAANAMYDSGKMAGRGFLSGLQGQVGAIDKLMQQIARNLVATLKRELGIRSPSEVMREHGRLTGTGLALGLEDSIPLIAASSARMARAAAGGTGTAAADGSPGRIVIELRGDAALRQWLKKSIRITGGDVDVVGA